MRVLIIEDEEAAARGLMNILKACDPGMQILSVQDSVQGSVNWLKKYGAPDLIFMDIQLIDGISFRIFDKVSVEAPVIFCTAYDRYALEAFKVNGIDYLLKPIDREDVEKSLERISRLEKRAVQNLKLGDLSNVINKLKDEKSYKSRFLVRAGTKFFYVDVNEIAFFFTKDHIHYLKTFDNRQLQLDKSLEELELLLNPADFFRINRQTILALKSIQRIENDYRRLLVVTQPERGEALYVSRQRSSGFKQWLDQ